MRLARAALVPIFRAVGTREGKWATPLDLDKFYRDYSNQGAWDIMPPPLRIFRPSYGHALSACTAFAQLQGWRNRGGQVGDPLDFDRFYRDYSN